MNDRFLVSQFNFDILHKYPIVNSMCVYDKSQILKNDLENRFFFQILTAP